MDFHSLDNTLVQPFLEAEKNKSTSDILYNADDHANNSLTAKDEVNKRNTEGTKLTDGYVALDFDAVTSAGGSKHTSSSSASSSSSSERKESKETNSNTAANSHENYHRIEDGKSSSECKYSKISNLHQDFYQKNIYRRRMPRSSAGVRRVASKESGTRIPKFVIWTLCAGFGASFYCRMVFGGASLGAGIEGVSGSELGVAAVAGL